MSLKVWLPLNGDLTLRGTGEISVVNNGAIIDNAGKIGKCYSFNGSTGYIALSNNDLFKIFTGGEQQFSITMWVFHADTTRAILFGDYATTGGIGFNIELGTSHKVRFYWNGSPDVNFSNTYAQEGGWSHIAIIYDGTKILSYIDGIAKGSWTGILTTKNKTSGEFRLGRDTRSDSTAFNGKMNDFRIYDHALSAAEVKEISLGLVVHYKLDLDIYLGENIIPNSLNMPLGSANPSTGTWRLAGTSNMDRSRVAITDTPEGSGYGFLNSGILTANDGSCYGIDNFPMKANTDYTISMWARIIEGNEGYAGFNVYNSTPKNGYREIRKNYYSTKLSPNGEWTRCWMTFTTNSATTRNIYIGITTGDNSVTTLMCNVHIEEGSIDNSKVIDSSGYNNHGTSTKSIATILNSPRYQYGINLSKVYITSSTGFPIGTNPNFTISFWTKIFSNITYVSYGDLCGMYDTGQGSNTFRLELCGSPASNNLMWFRGPSGQSGGGFNMNSSSGSGWFSKDVWHHIVLIGDGINKMYYCYLDGEKCGTYNGAANSWEPTGQFYVGDSIEATASFSDFRIYATALSESDIKQLYNTNLKIDDKHNIHTFTIEESNLNSDLITKTGSLKSINFNENGYLEFLHYDKEIYTEPDGSKWVHVFHHNNPAATKFNNTNQDWLHGKYMNADAWYDLEPIVSNLVNYEFLYRQKTTDTGSITTYRWTQPIDPVIATWIDVSPSSGNVVYNTSTGYTNSNMGGMYLMKSSLLHMCIANASNGNWFGGLGVSTAYQGGIPGFPNTVVTTGCIDLYVRIYLPTKLIKDKGISTLQYIEK